MEAKLSHAYTSSLSEGELHRVEVQTLIREGLPRFDIIGLPQNVIREGRDRVVACLQRLGVVLKNLKILVSLTPAEVKKEGGHFDLAILSSILTALGHLPPRSPQFLWGELSLDGRILPPKALLAHALFAETFQPQFLFFPPNSSLDSHLFESQAFCLERIEDLFEPQAFRPRSQDTTNLTRSTESLWNSLLGSEDQFLFWSLVMLGRLHVILEGPPGVGKTRWISSALGLSEPLTATQQRERLIRIPESAFFEPRCTIPVERPHHSASRTALLGGGSGRISAGAISRAHHGILVLDEIAEFSRDVLEGLRESLESKSILVHRGAMARALPADIQVLATMNPCRCGLHGSDRLCVCGTRGFDQYQAKLSGPIRDRFHFIASWRYQALAHATAPFRYESLVKTLSHLRQQPSPQVHASHVPKFQSRRREERWRESFETWLRWHHRPESTPSDRDAFQDFLGRLEINNLLEGETYDATPIQSRRRSTRGSHGGA